MTVIVPVFNVEAYIAECISSVQNQTYKNFECLVINDGSKDRSIPIVREMIDGDTRFKIISQQNGGLASARNLGLVNAKGTYIAFLDADDFWSPEKLSNQVSIFEMKRDVDVVFSNSWILQEGTDPFLYGGPHYKSNPLELLAGNVIVGSGSSEMLRSSKLATVGLYRTSLRSCEDLEFWYRCAVNGLNFYFDKTPSVFVRVRSGSLSRDTSQMQVNNIKAFRWQLELLRNRNFSKSAILHYSIQRIQNSRKYFKPKSKLVNAITFVKIVWVFVKGYTRLLV